MSRAGYTDKISSVLGVGGMASESERRRKKGGDGRSVPPDV